ncbi:MAG: hypothetical protein SCALA702_02620 [Melioribacteraceae bacterium]|nr:MAG: hypothetical protein SCALA702_02620 [Melioribacteraceae bacterium]
MGGKAAILLVLGFSAIFLGIGNNLLRFSGRAADNFVDYYRETLAYNIAVSGANMASNEIYINKTWTAGFSNISFDGGTIDVVIDTVGELKKITSTGTYEGLTHTVEVLLQPSYFSKFGNYYNSMSAAPATGDTFNGPFHVNGRLYTYGSPVFWGKVTSKSGLTTYWSKDPQFYGGFETGIDIPLEFDTSGMRSNAGKVFNDTTGSGKGINMRLYFNDDGSVTYSYNAYGDTSWTTPVTEDISTLSSNGVIYVEKGNIYTKGTVDGSVTIVATGKGSSSYGYVYQVDDLKYDEDPRDNENSDDILGIVAERHIRLQYNDDTKNDDIITQASMFSLLGNIGPDDNLINQGFLGRWDILGGLIAANTRQTAQYHQVSGIWLPYKGLKFIHTYDSRFMSYVPPEFPHTRFYEVLSWYE